MMDTLPRSSEFGGAVSTCNCPGVMSLSDLAIKMDFPSSAEIFSDDSCQIALLDRYSFIGDVYVPLAAVGSAGLQAASVTHGDCYRRIAWLGLLA